METLFLTIMVKKSSLIIAAFVIAVAVNIHDLADTKYVESAIYKNGSSYKQSVMNFNSSYAHNEEWIFISATVEFNAFASATGIFGTGQVGSPTVYGIIDEGSGVWTEIP